MVPWRLLKGSFQVLAPYVLIGSTVHCTHKCSTCRRRRLQMHFDCAWYNSMSTLCVDFPCYALETNDHKKTTNKATESQHKQQKHNKERTNTTKQSVDTTNNANSNFVVSATLFETELLGVFVACSRAYFIVAVFVLYGAAHCSICEKPKKANAEK